MFTAVKANLLPSGFLRHIHTSNKTNSQGTSQRAKRNSLKTEDCRTVSQVSRGTFEKHGAVTLKCEPLEERAARPGPST
ncbi:hypothetical protein COCON_G00190280 [Conger conger]|uniref:Uncharacterized protein n=1 Tax=Conger conger TaxID=82655 RepID=A0A9Q1HQB2_CONCO|nr:hypothetical protein COCON_G00190280 [Conger conger]